MGEIKSAIELAMERTKSLVMDDEEKKTFLLKDLDTRVRGLVRRYAEGMADPEDLGREYRDLKGDETQKKTLLLDAIVDEVDLRDEEMRILDIFAISGTGLDEGLKAEAQGARERAAEELERKEMIIRERALQGLTASGISGSSIEVNVEAWDGWQEGLDETKAIFRKRLADWKKKVKEQILHS
jgi:hypothetical protein